MSIINEGFYRCNKCGYFNPQYTFCILKQIKVQGDQYCDNFIQEPYVCDNCHQLITGNPLFWTREDGELKILCLNCFKRM